MATDREASCSRADRPDRARARSSGGRLVHLDNLKIVLTTGVIVAHAAMTYGAVGTWVYEEPSLSDAGEGVLGALVGLGVMFGLGLFFLHGRHADHGPVDADSAPGDSCSPGRGASGFRSSRMR